MTETNKLVTIILVSYFSKKNLIKLLKQIPTDYNIVITENSLDRKLKYEIEENYKNTEVLIPKTNLGNGGIKNDAGIISPHDIGKGMESANPKYFLPFLSKNLFSF